MQGVISEGWSLYWMGVHKYWTIAFATDVIGNACICQKRLLSMISWLRHMKGKCSNASCFL